MNTNTLRDSWRNFSKIPFSIILIVTIISCYGFLILYSASNASLSTFAGSQMIKFFVFITLAIIIGCFIKLDFIYKMSYIFFILNVFLLLCVHKFGSIAKGGARWLNLGFFKLQPSEIAKLSIILFLARYFHDLTIKRVNIINIIPPFVITIIPTIIIVKQPDLGTGIICLGIVIFLIFMVGLRFQYFITAIFVFLCLGPLLWSNLHEYQKKRILIFLHPEEDLLGAGYNIQQSKIAIGSGGFFGKGFLNGSQGQLHFLPEFQTDFAFALLCEEFGFVGAISLIVLYFILLMRYFIVSINCKSTFAKIIVVGISTMLFLHCFINIGMVMGLIPAVGVPLPFVSYGGTTLGVMLIGMGLIINADINCNHVRFK